MHGEACMHIIRFKMFCVSVSTGTSKGDKSLKISSDANSEGVIFRLSWGHMSPDPLVVLTCFTSLCALHSVYDALLPFFKSQDLPFWYIASYTATKQHYTTNTLHYACICIMYMAI